MKSVEDVEKFLQLVKSKPAMFWGGGEHPFSSLVAFLAGYKIGSGTAPESPIAPEKLIPNDFHGFVARRLARRSNGKGWSDLIREHTRSEEEAFDLFFRLRKEYEAEVLSG